MTADARDYALKISEPLFRLITESVRLRSNETCSHESLSSLTLHLVTTERDIAFHDIDVLRQHLNLISATGDITMLLALPPRYAGRLEAMRTCLEKRVGRMLTFEDALSLLLFDYVVEQKAARVLNTLGLGPPESLEPGGDAAPFLQ